MGLYPCRARYRVFTAWHQSGLPVLPGRDQPQ